MLPVRSMRHSSRIFGARERSWRRGRPAPAAETSPLLEHALQDGWNVVLANKRPIAGTQASVDRLHELNRQYGTQLLYGRPPLGQAFRCWTRCGSYARRATGYSVWRDVRRVRLVFSLRSSRRGARCRRHSRKQSSRGTPSPIRVMTSRDRQMWRARPNHSQREPLAGGVIRRWFRRSRLFRLGLRSVSRGEFIVRIGELDAADGIPY